MSVKRFTMSDGRRAEEYFAETTLADGSVEQVTETREEAIPMKVSKKVTKKMATVPVEEKIEVFEDDGGVRTTVKIIADETLKLREMKEAKDKVDLSDVLKKLDDLTKVVKSQPSVPQYVSPPVATVSPANVASNLQAKFEATKFDNTKYDTSKFNTSKFDNTDFDASDITLPVQQVIEEDRPNTEKLMTLLMWGAVAAVSALLYWAW